MLESEIVKSIFSQSMVIICNMLIAIMLKIANILMRASSRHDMRDATRVLVMDQGFAILDSLEDEIPGLEGGLLGQAGGSALATVPNALVRSGFFLYFSLCNTIFLDGQRSQEY